MNPLPKMHITTIPGAPSHHSLKGWDELNRWGIMNHPVWSAVQKRVMWAEGMSDIDKLRLLAGEMLRLNVDLSEQNSKLMQASPVSFILPPTP